MIKEYFSGIWRDRYILFSLVNRDLQNRYRHSVFGVAWSILTPLGLVLLIGAVYSIIFGEDPNEFIPILFTGLIPWFCLIGSADGGTNAFIHAEGYLKQTMVNAQIFPIRVVLVNFVNFLYSVLSFFAIYLFLQPDKFGPIMLMIFPGFILFFVFCVSLSNITSSINLYFRDFQPFQALIFQGLFYATPIIFTPEMLDEKGFSIIYQINPFYYLLDVMRKPMLGDSLSTSQTYLISLFMTLLLFIVSIVIQMKVKKEVAFKL